MPKIEKEELNFIRGEVRFDEPMSRRTTFKIGGPADIWVEPKDVDDILNILRYAKDKKMDVFVIGGGSKILVGDKGIRGFTVSLSVPLMASLEFDPVRDGIVDVDCGVKTSEFINEAAGRNLGGCEFLAGVPGTIGGAIMMNAGWPEEAIGNYVEGITAIKDLETIHLKKSDLKFSYRSSGLQASGLEGLILLSAEFKLEKKDRDKIAEELRENIDKKKKTQDLNHPSAGSIFLNPSDKIPAWKLIELSGFKGYTVGDAAVSQKHANFIINRGKATAADVCKLIDEIQKKVFKDHQIMLKSEVKLIGEF